MVTVLMKYDGNEYTTMWVMHDLHTVHERKTYTNSDGSCEYHGYIWAESETKEFVARALREGWILEAEVKQ